MWWGHGEFFPAPASIGANILRAAVRVADWTAPGPGVRLCVVTESPELSVRVSHVDEIRGNGGFDLFRLHAQESEPTLASFLAPDWAAYLAREDAGELIVLAAWKGDELVGYAVAWLLPSTHYRGRVLCQQDLLFVAPAMRGRGLGMRLVQVLREQARMQGAHRLLMHAKVGSQLIGVLEVAGLTPEEVLFSEELSE